MLDAQDINDGAAGLVIDDRGSQALLQDHTSVAWPLIRMLGDSAVRREVITESHACTRTSLKPPPKAHCTCR